MKEQAESLNAGYSKANLAGVDQAISNIAADAVDSYYQYDQGTKINLERAKSSLTTVRNNNSPSDMANSYLDRITDDIATHLRSGNTLKAYVKAVYGVVFEGTTFAVREPLLAPVQVLAGPLIGQGIRYANVNSPVLSIPVSGLFGSKQVFINGPYGSQTVTDFSQFVKSLDFRLGRAGYEDVSIIFQGSSVTGQSFKTGKPFNMSEINGFCKTSDYDMDLSSSELFGRARELGIKLRQGGTRIGELSPSNLRDLGLEGLGQQMSSKSDGRDVNFMLYQSTEQATSRSPSILFPKKDN